MIAIESEGLVAVIDPDHGGEILELIAPGGARPFGRPPFAPAAAMRGDLDESTWTASYRGGWQIAAPNAGNACDVDGIRHGFHGQASTALWDVEERTVQALVLGVSSHGLRFRRNYLVADGSLLVETTVVGEAEQSPLIAVEHLVCGINLLEPSYELSIGGGVAYEVDESSGPSTPPSNAPEFPAVLGLDGEEFEGASWPADKPRGRFFVVANLAEGCAEVSNPRTGEGLSVRWDVAALPHLWVWHESGVSAGLWRSSGQLLGIEPSMTPHSLGVAHAVSQGQARIIGRGQSFSWWVSVTPSPPTK